jgi:hypothetical protein
MWPHVSIEETSENLDRMWSWSEVSARHRWSPLRRNGAVGDALPSRLAFGMPHELSRLPQVASLTRNGTGRRISSISRVSCAARRSSRAAFTSASSARLRSAAFWVASCRSLQLSDHAPMLQPAIGITLCFGVGSMTGGGLAQLVKDCTVVCVDGIAADTGLTGERSHCRAACAIT